MRVLMLLVALLTFSGCYRDDVGECNFGFMECIGDCGITAECGPLVVKPECTEACFQRLSTCVQRARQ